MLRFRTGSVTQSSPTRQRNWRLPSRLPRPTPSCTAQPVSGDAGYRWSLLFVVVQTCQSPNEFDRTFSTTLRTTKTRQKKSVARRGKNFEARTPSKCGCLLQHCLLGLTRHSQVPSRARASCASPSLRGRERERVGGRTAACKSRARGGCCAHGRIRTASPAASSMGPREGGRIEVHEGSPYAFHRRAAQV